MTTSEAIYFLRETKKLVARKEKMKVNARKPFGCQQRVQHFSQRALPSLHPDFGVSRLKPYIFISQVFAFDTVLNKLDVNLA